MSDGTTGTAKAAKSAALTPDLCVIGAGARGIAVATAAAAFGVPVVLVERGCVGGSERGLAAKALIEAGARMHAIREASRLGIAAGPPALDAARLHDHLQRALSTPAANHRPERLQGLGITLLTGEARFASRSTLVVGEHAVKARRFVVAAGSGIELPPVLAGLDPALILTEDALATMTRLPPNLVVCGQGGQAVALAQAFRRLGSEVALVVPGILLPMHDGEAVLLLKRQLLREGVALLEDTEIAKAEAHTKGLKLTLAHAEAQSILSVGQILFVGDRRAEIGTLDLDLAGIRSDATGIVVDGGLRTANRRVYAIGSCAGGAAAGSSDRAGEEHVGIVLGNALFRRAGQLRPEFDPRIVWSRPEIASVGTWSNVDASPPGSLRILRAPLAETPAGLAADDLDGFVKVVSDAKGRIRGITIVGHGAAEMIAPWGVALKAGLTIQDVAAMPFATLSRAEASRLAALSFHRPATTSAKVRRLIGFLRRFG